MLPPAGRARNFPNLTESGRVESGQITAALWKNADTHPLTHRFKAQVVRSLLSQFCFQISKTYDFLNFSSSAYICTHLYTRGRAFSFSPAALRAKFGNLNILKFGKGGGIKSENSLTGKPGQSKVQPVEGPLAQFSGDSQKFPRYFLAVHDEQPSRELDRCRRAAASSQYRRRGFVPCILRRYDGHMDQTQNVAVLESLFWARLRCAHSTRIFILGQDSKVHTGTRRKSLFSGPG